MAVSAVAGGSTSIVPSGGIQYPFFISSSNFEPDGVTYINPKLIGDNLSIFIDESAQIFGLSEIEFEYVPEGIRITLAGFDANNFEYTVRIEKIYPIT